MSFPRLFSLATGLLLVTLASAALAGPIAEFNAAFRQTYASYRSALAVTNTPNREGSEKAVGALQSSWSAFAAKYRSSPPPQFAEDARWAETLDAVSAIVARASGEVAKGDIAAAHLTLEAVRERLAELRARNGVIAYSDRIDAFHHTMEEVAGKPYDGFAGPGLAAFREDVAVLVHLGEDLKRNPPPDAVQAPDFVPLLTALLDTVRDLQAAARAGDAEKIKAARAKLKPAFGRLFVKFG
ncbi:MAG: hypothetical protein ACK4UO_17035 [Pseudolabrys sp.]